MLQKRIPPLKRWLGDSPDETAFTPWGLKQALRRAGFVNGRVEPFDFLHPLTPAPLIAPVSGLGRIMERSPGLRYIAGSLHITATR